MPKVNILTFLLLIEIYNVCLDGMGGGINLGQDEAIHKNVILRLPTTQQPVLFLADQEWGTGYIYVKGKFIKSNL